MDMTGTSYDPRFAALSMYLPAIACYAARGEKIG